jgi:3-hydroxyacyl-CoA dehydrogenase
MKSPVSYLVEDGIAVISIDAPPVNALSKAVVQELAAAVEQFAQDRAPRALVLCCAGRTFVAGGDLSTFDDLDFETSTYNGTLDRLEEERRPVVAALHGTALGGGLELALACHWRIAQPGTRLGLPEVTLALLPGSLGTQRLPRLVGAKRALDMMLSGEPMSAEQSLECGLIDAIVPGDPQEGGLAYVRQLIDQNATPVPTRNRQAGTTGMPPSYWKDALALTHPRARGTPAPEAIVQCVLAAVNKDYAVGEAVERQAFDECRRSVPSRALRHLFFAEREATRIPDIPKDVKVRSINAVGVLGAGTMGTGIVMNFVNVGIPVVLVETTQEALDRGLARIRASYEATAAKGRMTADGVAQRLSLLTGSLDDTRLGDCDLVIEAVFESLALKKEVCKRLGQVCKRGAIIATNTSTLDVDVLAEATGRPEDVAGMHFFSPANIMKLLEVVRGARTSPDVLATVMAIAKRIGKIAVVSGVCYGFIGNRMAEVYMREAEFLLLEGASPAQIDGAVEALGLAMGPCRMLDMAGIDVGAKTVIEYAKAGGLPPDPRYRAVCQHMFAIGRHGQKTGKGYYRYEGRRAEADPEAVEIFADLARTHGVQRRDAIPEEEIVERLLYPLINEGMKILEEGIAYRPGDIDVVWTSGYGFPHQRGGPMFMAHEIGLAKIAERLRHYGAVHGNTFGYWDVAHQLERAV